MAILRWNSTGTIVAGNGSGGVFGNSLFSPFGFTFDDTNTMYITECTGHRVNKWISQASIGTVVAGSVSRTPSSALSGFNCSADILLDSNGDMYISDRHNDRLQFWQNGASSAVTVAGRIVSSDTQLPEFALFLGIGSNTSIRLEGPLGLARDMNTKEIYIASPHSHIVAAYPSGTVFGVTNVTSNVTPHLEGPEGITFDSFSNSLIIANGFGQSIVRWVLGSVNWTLIAGVPGVSGNDSMHLNRPIGLTMDPMGNIYVAEYSNDRVQLFMSGQAEGLTIAGAATNGTQLNGPSAVKLDSQLNLYVSDYLNNRVLKFARY